MSTETRPPDWIDKYLGGWLPPGITQDVREVSNAPRAIVVILVLGAAGGWWAAAMFYAERFAAMQAQVDLANERAKAASSGDVKATLPAVIQGWSGGQINRCRVTVNGARLEPFAKDYKAVLICGTTRSGIDRITDSAITISQPFSIDTTFILEAAVTNAMRDALLARSSALPRPAVPPGTPLSVNAQLWYEVVLVPRQLDVSALHALADVERLGGKLLPAEERRAAVVEVPLR